ncbi:hypothetical protein HDV63DRAFT_28690 [Trichoderma sp. SZMC 28014]
MLESGSNELLETRKPATCLSSSSSSLYSSPRPRIPTFVIDHCLPKVPLRRVHLHVSFRQVDQSAVDLLQNRAPLLFVYGKPALFGSSIEQIHLAQSPKALLGPKAVSGESSRDPISEQVRAFHHPQYKAVRAIRKFLLLLVCHSSLYSVALPSFIWLGHWRNLLSVYFPSPATTF